MANSSITDFDIRLTVFAIVMAQMLVNILLVRILLDVAWLKGYVKERFRADRHLP